MFLPLLIVLTYGSYQIGRVQDFQNTVSYVTQDGGDLASGGQSLSAMLDLTMEKGSVIGLEARGGLVVSRLVLQDGAPAIQEQVASAGYRGGGRIGAVGDAAGDLPEAFAYGGPESYVFEFFYERPPLVPALSFLSVLVPEVLYERVVF
jgi:hypothetical protein